MIKSNRITTDLRITDIEISTCKVTITKEVDSDWGTISFQSQQDVASGSITEIHLSSGDIEMLKNGFIEFVDKSTRGPMI